MSVCRAVCLSLHATSLPLPGPKPYQEFDLRVFKVKSTSQSGTQYSVQYPTILQSIGLLGGRALKEMKERQIEWRKKEKERGMEECLCGCGFFLWGGEVKSIVLLRVALETR